MASDFIRKISFCLLLATHGFAQSPLPRSSFDFQGIVGLNLLAKIIAKAGSSENRIAPLVGIRGDYFFSDTFGVFMGMDALHRGAKLVGGETARASFLDLPFGITIGHGSWIFPENTTFQTSLGPQVSLPLSDLESNGVLIQQSRHSFGGYFQCTVLAGNRLRFGGTLWAKAGFTSAFVSSSLGTLKSILELGVGLVIAYS